MKFILLIIIILIIIILYKEINYENYDSQQSKKVFITFGAGGKNYYEAVNRLTNEADKLNIFDTVIGYNDTDLKNDPIFWNEHSDFITKNKRGFGYWLWKPYLILKTLENMNDGDILVYADCGCEIFYNKRDNFFDLFDVVKTDLIVGSYTAGEKEYTKMDLLLYLDVNDDKYFTAQHQASTICILKCDKTYALVKEWYEVGCNYNLINDTPSNESNHPSFIEHRHDQSIFSLLTKKYNIYSKTSIDYAVNISRKRSGY